MSLRAVHRPVSRTGAPLTGVRRFASPAVMAVLRRRVAELIGLVAALIGLALFVALASHDPADPSLSTATTRTPANLVGPAGAYLSDLLLQGFGWAAYLPGLALRFPRNEEGGWPRAARGQAGLLVGAPGLEPGTR